MPDDPLQPAQPLRADAARNSERIVRAAHAAFARDGLGAQMEDIAADAGVGLTTLYRRFPNKAELVKAVLYQQLVKDLTPALERADREKDPLKAVIIALEAALTVTSREQRTLTVATDAGVMKLEMGQLLFGPLSDLIGKAQAAGALRADLTLDDTPRLLLMLVGTLPSFDVGSDGWRRYLALLMCALTSDSTSPLPPPTPVREHQPSFRPMHG